MVIFYNKTTKDILYTEAKVMYPILPEGSITEKRRILGEQNVDFIGVHYEMGMEIFDMKVGLNETGEFIGLQPKEPVVVVAEVK